MQHCKPKQMINDLVIGSTTQVQIHVWCIGMFTLVQRKRHLHLAVHLHECYGVCLTRLTTLARSLRRNISPLLIPQIACEPIAQHSSRCSVSGKHVKRHMYNTCASQPALVVEYHTRMRPCVDCSVEGALFQCQMSSSSQDYAVNNPLPPWRLVLVSALDHGYSAVSWVD